MRLPNSLSALVDHGILDEVVRPLMSGKEAQVYLVLSGGAERVAKVYKEAENRTFKHRSDYTEGRRVRNSRDQRAMEKRSRHGRAQDEQAWRSAEVDIIYRLRDAGVRVPQPFHFIDGVLIMELVTDALGAPAPRLGDLTYTPEEAQAIFDRLITEVTRMLCAGVVHGDLSDFNVLMAADGPVIIDFPQAVNAASNQNARRILERDVANLQRFLSRFSVDAKVLPYAQELWELYQRNALTPDTRLTGRVRAAAAPVKTEAVMSLVRDAERDERKRREFRGLDMRGMEPERPGAAARDVRGAPRDVRGAPRDVRGGARDVRGGARDAAPRTHAEPQRDAPAPQRDAPAPRRDAPARGDVPAPRRDAPAHRQNAPRTSTREAREPREQHALQQPRENPSARPDIGRRGEFAARPAFRQDDARPAFRQDDARPAFRQDDARQQPRARQQQSAREPAPARQQRTPHEEARSQPARSGGFRSDDYRAEGARRSEAGPQVENAPRAQATQPKPQGAFGPRHDKPFRRDS